MQATSAEVSYFDFLKCGFNNCMRNTARRLDTTYWNFLTTYAQEY